MIDSRNSETTPIQPLGNRADRDRRSLRNRGLIAVAVLSLLLPVACAAKVDATMSSATAEHHFFPSRPSGAKLRTITGKLEEFGIGNASGAVVIETGVKRAQLYTGANLRLDGKRVACDHPPSRGSKRSILCTSWPSNVVVGTTIVTATYWSQAGPGSVTPVDVTDELRSVK